MTLDVSLEAIEADLLMADRGGQVAAIALARAQVRATLLAAQPVDHQGRHEAPTPVWVNDTGQDILIAEGPDAHVFTVPKAAAWEDRVTAAAMLLGVDHYTLEVVLHNAFVSGATEATQDDVEPPAEPLVDPTRITTRNTEDDPRNDEEPDDDTEDVFAEARKARSKK